MALALGLSTSGACPGPTCSSSAGSSFVAGWQGASLRAACLGPWRCTRPAPRRRRQQPLRAALLDPPAFDPEKLRVEYLPGALEPQLAAGRRYTLTHNDVTGSLQLAIGREYNRAQLDGWYTRMLRDEILAEWRETAAPVRSSSSSNGSSSNGSGSDGEGGSWRNVPQPSLHVYCHVSGEELWPAPPALRSFIFQREMTLVLDTIMHAERDMLLAAVPALADAPVYVHLHSDIPALDRVVEWGRLGDRTTWRGAQNSMLGTLLSSVLGTLDEADSDGSDGSWSRGAFSASSSWDGGAGGGGVGLGAAASGAVAWAGGSWDGGDHPQPQQQQVQQQQLEEQQQREPGVAAGSASNGAAAEHPVPGEAAACTASGGSSSSNGSGGLGAANSAVSLAAVQQADYSSWLGATAVVAEGRRRPAEIVPAAVRSRQR